MGRNDMGDDLEQMFAAEEAAIRDDGFTKSVMDQATRAPGFRRVAIYGAGMTGFGIAVGSMPALMSAFPQVGRLFSAADSAVATASNGGLSNAVNDALASGSQTMLVVLAAALVVSVSLAVMVMQER